MTRINEGGSTLSDVTQPFGVRKRTTRIKLVLIFFLFVAITLHSSAEGSYLSAGRVPIFASAEAHPNSLDSLSSDQREVFLSTGLLLLLCAVVLSLFVSQLCKAYRVEWLPAPLIAVVFGMALGAGLRLGFSSHHILLNHILVFNDDIFFIGLLPPIIFQSGFSLTGRKANHFFKNFGAILWFAMFATFVAFATIGSLFFASSILHLGPQLSLKECFTFGAIISSTDPVAPLTLLDNLKAHPLLYSIVSGESLMNDAFSIVLYRTVAGADSGSLLHYFCKFVVVFLGSVLIGVAIGLIAALIYKYLNLQRESNRLLESALLLLFVWISYLVSEGLSMSGIVSILFSGITMAHYTFVNLSNVGQTSAKSMFGSLALLAEITVFVLLGVAVFSAPHPASVDWRLYAACVVIVSVSRAVSVYVTSFFVNLFRRTNKITSSFQHVIVLCGVRGAVAFALALRSRHDIGERGEALLSATLFYAILTIVLVGALLPRLLRHSGLDNQKMHDATGYGCLDEFQAGSDRCPPAYNAPGSSLAAALEPACSGGLQAPSTYYGNKWIEEEELVSGTCGVIKRLLVRLDRKIMKPLFTNEDYALTILESRPSSIRDVELTVNGPRLQA